MARGKPADVDDPDMMFKARQMFEQATVYDQLCRARQMRGNIKRLCEFLKVDEQEFKKHVWMISNVESPNKMPLTLFDDLCYSFILKKLRIPVPDSPASARKWFSESGWMLVTALREHIMACNGNWDMIVKSVPNKILLLMMSHAMSDLETGDVVSTNLSHLEQLPIGKFKRALEIMHNEKGAEFEPT